MTLDKAIESGQEKRKHYRKSKAFDPSCRNHGGCPYCENGRAYRAKKRAPASEDIDMHNLEQAKSDAEDLYNNAVQSEIGAILAHDGAMHNHSMAQKIGKTRQETRWHLEQMRERGDIEYSWIKGYSV